MKPMLVASLTLGIVVGVIGLLGLALNESFAAIPPAAFLGAGGMLISASALVRSKAQRRQP